MRRASARCSRIFDAAERGREGRRLDVLDLLTACTALDHGEPVVTRNRDHFERIPGLEVLSY